jgi:hypothetical protein
MPDLSWLSQEAKQLHAIFEQLFYGLALVLLLLGVVIEYFKLPLGGMPQFQTLAGRALVAAILLVTYPQISNLIADFTDTVSAQIGSLNSIKLVLARYYDKLFQFQMSWTSLKDSILMLISFVTFFLLYISVYIADAAITYAWVLLYVFSPLLIALYVLPVTSGAKKALYRSLFEIGAWKIVWSVLATLLWSSALSQINEPQNNINFITAVSFNLILAGSLLLTPLVVNALAGAGLAGLAAQTAGIAAGAAAFNPGQLVAGLARKKSNGKASSASFDGGGGGGADLGSFSRFQDRYSDKPEGEGAQKTQKRPRTGKTGAVAFFQLAPPQESGGGTKRGPSGSAPHREDTVSFKTAVAHYDPPVNRSDYRKQPVQQELFVESRKPKGSNSLKGV